MVISRQFWMDVREGMLTIVSAIERLLSISPTTKECRELVRQMQRGQGDR